MTLLLARCATDRSRILSDTLEVINSDDEIVRNEENVRESTNRVGDEGEDESKGLGSTHSDLTRVKKGRSKGHGGSFEWAQAAEVLVQSGSSAHRQLLSLRICLFAYVCHACMYAHIFV